MKRFLTFSIMCLFAACSYGTTVLTAHEPHKETAVLYELLKKDEDDDDE
jgi:hypothetical protein